jgi:hypothetical protein
MPPATSRRQIGGYDEVTTMRAAEALTKLAAGDWEGAHALVQDDPSPEAAWVHAHLHRVEGDLSNADYWYRRAGKPAATGSHEDERAEIERTLQGRRPG